MQTFQECLEAYGCDYAGIVQRFMGNEAMYRRLLEMFFKDDSMEKLQNALCSGDLTEAFESAHTLKGVTGNLGLTPLYNAVCAIVEPLRRQDTDCDCLQLFQAIAQEYQKVEALRDELKRVV